MREKHHSGSLPMNKLRKLLPRAACKDLEDKNGSTVDDGRNDSKRIAKPTGNVQRRPTTRACASPDEGLGHPGHDHCYTGSGKFIGIDTLPGRRAASSHGQLEQDLLCRSQFGIAAANLPYMYVSLLANIAQVLEVRSTDPSEPAIEELEEKYAGLSTEGKSTTVVARGGIRSSLAHPKLKIIVAVSEESDPVNVRDVQCKRKASSEQGTAAVQSIPDQILRHCNQVKDTVGDTGTPKWERKLALKCLRDLQTRKKNEGPGLLACKICKYKDFTAKSSLLLHYRSHAGIRPYNCTICDKTFTRRHSLIYHILVHKNKCLYACPCGRRFRHHGHYKDHLQWHTGDMLYECTKCYLKFHTRPTYNRHMKSKHGVVPTSRGIAMSEVS